MAEDFSNRLNNIEQKWQQKWDEEEVHRTERTEAEKYYVLEMFPYPSGNLHMGHVRCFSLGDAPARMKRMQGYNVMHPMGWDAFGLPAENAAIDRGVDPEEWTRDCIDQMRGQFKSLGFSFDWDREVATCDPEYYKWNQWLFLEMLDNGLAYEDESKVNWCPGCETVLADEQVEDGLCWRCDSVVEQKDMEQWFLKITDYADELLEDLNQLDGWPDKVRKMQDDWIGKSTGAKIRFDVKDSDRELEVFTTRPDTIFGATFMALAPEHELTGEIAENNEEVEEYREEAMKRDSEEREEKSRAGVFTGRYAENPLTGEEIPIYVAEFILTDYGTGAIMAVPAHDQRDFEFAQEHGIEVREVVEPEEEHDFEEESFEGNGKHVNSKFLNGLDKEDAIEKIIEKLEDEEIGEADVNFKLRDWLISRQRYWGTPIPIIHCDTCGTVPVPEEDLPVELPEDVEFTETGNPIETSETWAEVKCPECGEDATRETDTMDTFIGSSWYFLRYISPELEDAPFEVEDANYWMNVDQYIGGIEHAVMHLLYSRFFTKFLRDQDMLEEDEPFERLLTLGMVNHPAYKCPEHGWLYPEEVEDDNICEKCGHEVEVETRKMSKSKHNVVDPTELIDEYGADVARLFILRASHPTKELDWSQDGVEASMEMLERIYRIVKRTDTTNEESVLNDRLEDRIVATKIQRVKQKVTEHMEDYEFNLAINELDKLLTQLYWYEQREPDQEILSEGIRSLVKMISPFSPHLAEDLWQEDLGHEEFMLESDWPEVKETLLDEEAEKIDEYFDSVSSDIRDIQELFDDQPETIKIIQSTGWKYSAAEAILEEIEKDNKDVGDIMSQVLDADLKSHAEDINSMVVDAVENPGKFQKQFVPEDLETEALEQNQRRWKDEFDAEIKIERQEESEEDKATRAEPGRPAIVMD
jgi:leucyl-tRNA synthetase